MSYSDTRDYRGYKVEISKTNTACSHGFAGEFKIFTKDNEIIKNGKTPIFLSKEMADRLSLSMALAFIDGILR